MRRYRLRQKCVTADAATCLHACNTRKAVSRVRGLDPRRAILPARKDKPRENLNFIWRWWKTEDTGPGFNSRSAKAWRTREDTRKKDKDKGISIWSGRET